MAGNSLVVAGRPPRLNPDELVRAQVETLTSPRRRYGVPARVLFRTLDTLYGKERTLSKFKVLELVARVPYQTWEQVAYIAITHVHNRTGLARRIYERVIESREQQDNEQWHLLILEELLARSGVRESRLKYYHVPQAIAFGYYQLSWLLYVTRPKWSYRLNADFEDHAEHNDRSGLRTSTVARSPVREGVAHGREFHSGRQVGDRQCDRDKVSVHNGRRAVQR